MSTKVTLDGVKAMFHLPIVQAAKEFGISLGTMKIAVRRMGIPRWPFRQVECMRRLIDGNFRNRQVSKAACRLIASIYADPTQVHKVPPELRRSINAYYKMRFEARLSASGTR
jgi:hypothetical protein